MNHKPGFRFKPTDEELIIDFLIPMVLGLISEVDVPIAEVEFLKHEPWDLPEFSKIQSNDPYWYFFYKLDIGKYLNSKRADRTTKGGYWKATGSDRQVKSREIKQVIGRKKTLVFHEGRVSKKVMSQGINWVIHEFHLTPNFPNPDAYVICCLKREAKNKTIGKAKKKANGEASTSIAVENQHIAIAAHLSPQLSHNSTQHVIVTHPSPQLSHNSTQQVTTTHPSPQLSHNSNACKSMYIEDFNAFQWPGLA